MWQPGEGHSPMKATERLIVMVDVSSMSLSKGMKKVCVQGGKEPNPQQQTQLHVLEAQPSIDRIGTFRVPSGCFEATERRCGADLAYKIPSR